MPSNSHRYAGLKAAFRIDLASFYHYKIFDLRSFGASGIKDTM
jgi:hypothetical protein